MAVEELGELHQRYVDLSQRFRAAWVFHQFLQSMGKLLGGEAPPPLAGPFQELYADLKECAQELGAAHSGRLAPRLDAIDRELAGLTATLRSEDTRWIPGDLRRFFRRYKNYDGKILVQLVRFYLLSQPVDEWSADRKDKVDFLATRLEEEERGNGLERREEMLASLWQATGAPAVPEARVDGVLRALADIRTELDEVTDLDDLERREALRTYRDFKHSLGALFFEPRVVGSVLTTNLGFRDVVSQLYAREEKQIAVEYQQVLDLGRDGEMAEDLDDELARFHQEVERFERNLERDELRLEDLSHLRQRVRSLVPRLARPAAEGESRQVGATGFGAAATAAGDEAAPDVEILAASYRRLLDALGSVTLGIPAESIVHSADLFPFQLEAREVNAYRRLLGLSPDGVGEPGRGGDEEPAAAVERFVLEAAALRVSLTDEAASARSIEGTIGGVDLPRLRRLAALGDAFVRRFEHLEQQALLDDRAAEARALAYLRVRLILPWSELWLLAHQELKRPAAD